jgi:phage shock protein A
MNILRRLFSIGKAETNSALDRLEDPIKMTEQGIKDLKSDLDQALHALAEIKALAIRARNDQNSFENKAKDYEKKAIMLLQRAEKGEMEMVDAERLANEALVKKNENSEQAQRSLADKNKFDGNVNTMESNIKKLRQQVSQFENELKTLKARVKVSAATKNINKQMSKIDSSGTVSMLERMKEKVEQDEALAESYGDIANESRSIDDEIDKALDGANTSQASNDLSALKARLGMNKTDDTKSE